MTGRIRSTDAGFSLIEVLVTVSIVGITFVVFVGGMGTSFLASDHHRKQAVAHASVRNFAEAVKAAPFVTDCAKLAPPYAAYIGAYSPPPPTRRSSAGSLANSASHVAPSLIPLSANTKLLAFFALGGGTTLTLPAGMDPGGTLSSQSSTPTSQVTVGFADQAVAAQAPTGTRTATSTTAADSVGQLVSVPTAEARKGILFAATPPPGGTSLSLLSPSATAVGDAMLAQVAVRGAATTVSPPPGWTLVSAKAHASSVKSLVFEKTATAAGSTPFEWTFSAVSEAAGGIVSYGGTSQSYIAAIDQVEFWNGTEYTTCPEAPENNNIQQVTLRVESTDQRAVQTIKVVKRCHDKPTPFTVCEDAP